MLFASLVSSLATSAFAQEGIGVCRNKCSEMYNTTSVSKGHLSMVLLNQIKPMILKNLGNNSRDGVSIVVGVITPNGTSVSGYGNISKANNTKVNGDSIFDIGSITKTFTTALLADMVKRGLVKSDDPLQKYLPYNVKVPTYHNDGHNITLEDLATHTSGLADLPGKLFENRTYPTQQIYNYVSHASLVSEPGVRYNYNNLGMGLLGHVLSLKAGVPYGAHTTPFNKIVEFLLDVEVITKDIKDDMMKINDLRNRYVHLKFESGNPGEDETSLNLLCKIIDQSSKSDGNRFPFSGSIDEIGSDIQKVKGMGVDHIVFVYNFLPIGRNVNEMIDTSKQLSKFAR